MYIMLHHRPGFSESVTERRLSCSPLRSEGDTVSTSNTEYYRRRAAAERELAVTAERQNVAEIHLELARLYDALVDQPALRPKLGLFNRIPQSA